ncbi:MAG: PIN domain-containing protein [Gemmatimonadota bacterium]|nr:PIN domain-containing protein [Gemmatimonadota bacterium]
MDVFVDTSVLLGITFGESRGTDLAVRLRGASTVFASTLLEAEFRSACAREGRTADLRLLQDITWVAPARPLSREIARVLDAGYLCGADCWHLATAIYLAPEPGELVFLTLDQRQQEVAAAVGFAW